MTDRLETVATVKDKELELKAQLAQTKIELLKIIAMLGTHNIELVKQATHAYDRISHPVVVRVGSDANLR
jgi:hypothetical protein